MKSGTLQFGTSMQRGLPVQIPNVFEKINKCVSADPLFKLCFEVNPNKKTVEVKVRVPGFKKAINAALKSSESELTDFQRRMFGNKVGNALHEIAKRIKVPSVDDIFKSLDNVSKRKQRRADREADRIAKYQQSLMKILSPTQKKRFKVLTSSNLFKLKCGKGRKGRICRRKQMDLLRKIARKVAGRKKRRNRRRRRRRKRRRSKKRECRKCSRHLQKFKVFNDRYRRWYKKYYKTWYQRHVSGPYYKHVLDQRKGQRQRMRDKINKKRKKRAYKRLKNTKDKTAVIQRAIHQNQNKKNSQKRTVPIITKKQKAETQKKAVPKQQNKATPKQQNEATPKQQNEATPKQQNKATPKQQNEATPKQQNEAIPKQPAINIPNNATPKQPNTPNPNQAAPKQPEIANKAAPKQSALRMEGSDYLNEYDDDMGFIMNGRDLVALLRQSENAKNEHIADEYRYDDDDYYEEEQEKEENEVNKNNEEEQEVSPQIFGFGHKIFISSTSFWILQIISILFGALLVLCTSGFFAMIKDEKKKNVENKGWIESDNDSQSATEFEVAEPGHASNVDSNDPLVQDLK